jgi:hypothetical protein
MKIIGGATRAELVPIDRETGKISGSPIPIKSTAKVWARPSKRLSYGRVKYRVEWSK